MDSNNVRPVLCETPTGFDTSQLIAYCTTTVWCKNLTNVEDHVANHNVAGACDWKADMPAKVAELMLQAEVM